MKPSTALQTGANLLYPSTRLIPYFERRDGVLTTDVLGAMHLGALTAEQREGTLDLWTRTSTDAFCRLMLRSLHKQFPVLGCSVRTASRRPDPLIRAAKDYFGASDVGPYWRTDPSLWRLLATMGRFEEQRTAIVDTLAEAGL